jgi:uncharacterized protein YlxW (UPF0749 family)
MNSTTPSQSAPKKDMSKQRAASQATFAKLRAIKAVGELVGQGYTITLTRPGEPDRRYSPGDLHP